MLKFIVNVCVLTIIMSLCADSAYSDSLDGYNKKLLAQSQTTNQTNRYIVELVDSPIFAKKFKLEQLQANHSQGSKNLTLSSSAKSQISSQVASYARSLQAKQTGLVAAWKKRNIFTKVLNRHSKLHNSIVVDLTDQQRELLLASKNVKKIHPVANLSKFLVASVEKVQASKVWAKTDAVGNEMTGRGVTVAIIDTGIDYTHSYLGGCFGPGCKVATGYDFVNQDDDPMDDDGHGTHLAGIVSASGETLSGVAPGATLMAVKVLNSQGFGSEDTVLAGIEYAVDPDNDPSTDDGADVINLSLGGVGHSSSPLSVAVNNATNLGVIVVVAAGNTGKFGDIMRSTPASAANVITVGSATLKDKLSVFSSKGASLANGQFKPEIVAPGQFIMSLALNNGYNYLSGTSMASPHVAGAAALLAQRTPGITPKEVKTLLISSAKDIKLEPFAQGHGRLDINQAVNTQLLLVRSNLMLGRVKEDQQDHGFKRYITLKNISANDMQLDVELPASFPQQVQFLMQDKVTIAANSQVTVPVVILVKDVSSMPFPKSDSGAFSGNIVFSTQQVHLDVPVTIERNHQFVLTHNSNRSVEVSIDDAKGKNHYVGPILPGQNKAFSLPPSQLFITARYKSLSVSDLPNIEFPVINSANQMSITGYEDFTLDITADTQLDLDVNDLMNVTGVDQVTNMQGSQDIASHKILGHILVNRFRAGRVNKVYKSHKSFGTGTDPISHFLVTGNKSLDIHGTYITIEKLTSNNKRSHDSYFHTFKTLDHQGELYALNEQQTKMINFTVPALFLQDSKGFSVSFNGYNSLAKTAINGTANTINYGTVGQSSQEMTSYFTVIDKHGRIAAKSNLLAFSEMALNKPENQGASIVTSGEQLTLAPIGLSFSSLFHKNFTSIYENRSSPFTAINKGQVFSGVETQYQLFCDGQSLASGRYDHNNALRGDTSNCNVVGLDLEFDSYLNNERFTSYARHLSTASGAFYFSGLKLHLSQAGKLLNGQNVSAHNTKLMVLPSKPGFNISVEKVEFKGGQQTDWTSLDFTASEEGAQQDNTGYAVTLPSVDGTAQAASIRITYNTGSARSVQTLNGLFNLGATANAVQ
jgi:subtilisin family serine protease